MSMVELVIMEHLSFSFVQVPLFLVSSSHLLFFSSSPPSPSFYSSPCVTCFSFFLSNDSLSPSSFSCVCCRVIPRPLLFFVYVLQATPPLLFFVCVTSNSPPSSSLSMPRTPSCFMFPISNA